MIESISQPWHWAISGFMIAFVMYLLLALGRRFGVSTSFKTVCNIAGGGRFSDYFRYDWKREGWLLLFVGGSMIGGYVAHHYMPSPEPVQIADSTVDDLQQLGIPVARSVDDSSGMLPVELFTIENILTLRGFIIMIVGGILIGFGTRWAGGCTSGHAISGLSNLQLPSLVAVVGFFIGGLLMTHVLFPIIFQL